MKIRLEYKNSKTIIDTGNVVIKWKQLKNRINEELKNFPESNKVSIFVNDKKMTMKNFDNFLNDN